MRCPWCCHCRLTLGCGAAEGGEEEEEALPEPTPIDGALELYDQGQYEKAILELTKLLQERPVRRIRFHVWTRARWKGPGGALHAQMTICGPTQTHS